MLVKIIHYDREKMAQGKMEVIDTNLIDCRTVNLNEVEKGCMWLQFDQGEVDECPPYVFEPKAVNVFVMNDNGKTIDAFRWDERGKTHHG